MTPALVRLLVGSDFHLGPLCGRFEARLDENVVPIFLGDLLNRPRADGPAWERLVPRWEHLNADLVVVPGNPTPRTRDAGRACRCTNGAASASSPYP